MEPSNRTRHFWSSWRRNFRAAEDDNAQEALIELDAAEESRVFPSSPPQQGQHACFGPDPAGESCPSPSPRLPPPSPILLHPPSPPSILLHPPSVLLPPPSPPSILLPPPSPPSVRLHPPSPPSILLQPPSPPSILLHPPSPPSILLNPPPVFVHQTRLGLLSLLDLDGELPSASDSSGGHGADNNDDEGKSGECAVVRQHRHGADNNDDEVKIAEGAVVRQHSSSDDSDVDEDPFLTDRFRNLIRLSDMEAAFEKHLEDEASKPKVEEKKYSKTEILKQNADLKKRYIECALQKYNSEEDLAGEMCFVFDEIKEEVYVVEEGMKFYEHFNFTAKQAGSMVLFFAEVVPCVDTCDVLCCKPLNCNDNGHCFGCKNQGSVNLRHPADEALYVGGHEDCEFPFMWDSITDSEDDSD